MSARYAPLVEQLEVARDIVLNAREHSREADEHGFDSSALIFDGTLFATALRIGMQVSSFMPTKNSPEGFHAHIQSPPFHGGVLDALCAYKHLQAQDLTLRTWNDAGIQLRLLQLFAHRILEAKVELAKTAEGLADFARTLHRQAQVYHPRQPSQEDVFARVTRGMLLPGDDRVPLCVVLWCMRRFHAHHHERTRAAWPENVVRHRQGYSWATATASTLTRFLRDRDLPEATRNWQQGLVGTDEVGEGSASAGLHMHDAAARKKMRTEYSEAFEYFASWFETLVSSQPHSLGYANHANVYFPRPRM